MKNIKSRPARRLRAVVFGAAAAVCVSAIAATWCGAAGLTVGETLKLSGSARSAALGGSLVLDYGPGGNPALTGGADTASFQFYMSPLDVSVMQAGGKYGLGKFQAGAWALSQSAGSVRIQRLPFEEEVSGADYVRKLQNDLVAALSCSYAPSQRISFGLTAKHISSTLLEEFSMSAAAFDAGFAWTPYGGVTLAFLAANTGNGASYSSSGRVFALPASRSAGVSASFRNILMEASADHYVADGLTSYSAGLQYRMPDEKVYPLNSLALRAGLRLPSGRAVSFNNFVMGFSLGFSRVLVEYAFLPLDDAGLSHKLGFTYRFAHRTVVPAAKIKQIQRILFVDGEFETASFRKLEDIAMLLKENPGHIVRLEGHFELIDKVLDYFTRVERLSGGIFSATETDAQWVDVVLIEK